MDENRLGIFRGLVIQQATPMDCVAFKSRLIYQRKMERLQRILSKRAAFGAAAMGVVGFNVLLFVFNWAGIDQLGRTLGVVSAFAIITLPIGTLGVIGYFYFGWCGRVLKEEILREAERAQR